jgi:hypothetical protein
MVRARRKIAAGLKSKIALEPLRSSDSERSGAALLSSFEPDLRLEEALLDHGRLIRRSEWRGKRRRRARSRSAKVGQLTTRMIFSPRGSANERAGPPIQPRLRVWRSCRSDVGNIGRTDTVSRRPPNATRAASSPARPSGMHLRISMDGRGRWLVLFERPWRSLKHEDFYLKLYADGARRILRHLK